MTNSGQPSGALPVDHSARYRSSKKAVAVLLLSAGAVAAAFAQDYWVKVPSPTTRDLNKVFFVDSAMGWIVGDQATVIRTSDGGLSWTIQDPGIPNNIGDVNTIFMLDRRIGWALATVPPNPRDTFVGTILLSTVNGGDSWDKEFFADEFFGSLYFSDSAEGWMGSREGGIERTTDGGKHWSVSAVDSTEHLYYPVHTIRFISPDVGYAVGGWREITGIVWKTTDGGDHWSATGLGDELFDVLFTDSLHALCVGGGLDDGAGVARTSDGGVTWKFGYIGYRGQAMAISGPTPSEGWVVLGNTGKCLMTTDAGSTWIQMYTPDSVSVTDVRFIDSVRGYMVGLGGSILRYKPPLVAVEIREGWNILSLPVSGTDVRASSVYTTAQSGAFAYHGSYETLDTVRYGEGFWMRFAAAETVHIRGPYRFVDTIDAVSGWNMIGTISFPTPVRSVIGVPDSLVISPFWGYDGAYQAADTLLQGRGYWVKTRSAGKLILHSPGGPVPR